MSRGVCMCTSGPPPGGQCNACGAWGPPPPWHQPYPTPPPILPPQRAGWVCGKCGASLAPWQADCPCSPAKPLRSAKQHSGSVTASPPYVGGDDDEIDEWRAECTCGWRGSRAWDQPISAYMELTKHLNESLR